MLLPTEFTLEAILPWLLAIIITGIIFLIIKKMALILFRKLGSKLAKLDLPSIKKLAFISVVPIFAILAVGTLYWHGVTGYGACSFTMGRTVDIDIDFAELTSIVSCSGSNSPPLLALLSSVGLATVFMPSFVVTQLSASRFITVDRRLQVLLPQSVKNILLIVSPAFEGATAMIIAYALSYGFTSMISLSFPNYDLLSALLAALLAAPVGLVFTMRAIKKLDKQL